jgi:hypothetical protein
MMASLLLKLQDLGPDGILQADGLRGLAHKHKVSPVALKASIKSDGKLTPRGQDIINRVVLKPSQKVSPDLLLKLRELGPDGIQREGSLHGLANTYDVSLRTLQDLIRIDGSVTPKGQAMIDEAEHKPSQTVTAALLLRIQALGADGIERAGGMRGIAHKYDVPVRSLQHCLLSDGSLTPAGQQKINNAACTSTESVVPPPDSEQSMQGRK